MYKVFEVEGGWEIFWCPSAPTHFNDKIPYDGKVYSKRPAAYRRVKQLNEQLAARTKAEGNTIEKAVAWPQRQCEAAANLKSHHRQEQSNK